MKVDIDGDKPPQENTLRRKRSIKKWKSFPATSNSFKGGSRSKKWTKDIDSDILHLNDNPLPKLPEEEEAVGIITMEDVIEELLQVPLTKFSKLLISFLSTVSHSFAL